jgi:hypothetical protein
MVPKVSKQFLVRPGPARFELFGEGGIRFQALLVSQVFLTREPDVT